MKEQIREMTDSEKLRNLADYFERLDKASANDEGHNEVQLDLRRIADNLENPPVSQTKDFLIAILESELKVAIVKKKKMLDLNNLGAAYVVLLATIEELERQLNELKG